MELDLVCFGGLSVASFAYLRMRKFKLCYKVWLKLDPNQVDLIQMHRLRAPKKEQ